MITPLLFREGLGGGSHFCTIRIFVAEDVTGKLDDHHLHTQTNAEGGDVVSASVFDCDNLTLDATLSETRTDNDTSHHVEFLHDVLSSNLFAIDEMNLCLSSTVDGSEAETLADTLVGILQVVLANQTYMHFLLSLLLKMQEMIPRHKST